LSFSKKQLKNYATGKRLLIVDDNKLTRKIFEGFFKHYFSFVVLARDGKDALEVYDKYRFDLVISDIKMPNMNGIELSKIIRDKNPEQAIMIISSVDDSESFINLIDIGVDAFVKKPLEADVLGEKVVKILEHQFFKDEINNYNKKIAIQEYLDSNNIELANQNEPHKSVSDVKKEQIAKIEKEEETPQEYNEYSAKAFIDDAKSKNNDINATVKALLEHLSDLEDNVSAILVDGCEEELIESISRVFSALYNEINVFDKLSNVADTLFEVHEFFADYKDLDHLSLDEIDAFEMTQFVLDDISNMIYGIFIKQNVNDIRVYDRLLRNSVEQIKLKLSAGENSISESIEFF
jgi:YesN/AraC family two-component response regulator